MGWKSSLIVKQENKVWIKTKKVNYWSVSNGCFAFFLQDVILFTFYKLWKFLVKSFLDPIMFKTLNITQKHDTKDKKDAYYKRSWDKQKDRSLSYKSNNIILYIIKIRTRK